jgi:AcrR family transcriptional regulator
MLPCVPGRKSSREKILDAAAELVTEIGAGRLTLDAVAERAGLSKGGLLYNFKTKDALLQAMIQRMIDQVHAEKEAIRGSLAGSTDIEARLCLYACQSLQTAPMKEVANGLLAALAENPKLLEPVRVVLTDVVEKIKATSTNPQAAFLAWLAMEGLNSMTMHDINPFSEADRKMITKAAEQLIDKGIAV